MAALRAGLVIGLPTDTVYGLAAAPLIDGAVDRIFAAKRRPAGLDLPVLVSDIAQARDWAAGWPPWVERLALGFWPGALTLVVSRRPDLTSINLGQNSATVGLRCPDHAIPRALCSAVGPLATTSANRHGAAPLESAAAVRAQFGEEVAVVIDGGRCAGAPSTVVDCTGPSPVLIREGRVPWAEVAAAATR
jgi:tRNA threonylcarbamoyl adenosine modification protein (Sua5/YciO/YrdC/YwlC family)